MSRDSTYSTTDLALAAFLMSQGHGLLKVEGLGKKTFHFPPEAGGDVQGYYMGEELPARDFAHAMRDLKAMCRQI